MAAASWKRKGGGRAMHHHSAQARSIMAALSASPAFCRRITASAAAAASSGKRKAHARRCLSCGINARRHRARCGARMAHHAASRIAEDRAPRAATFYQHESGFFFFFSRGGVNIARRRRRAWASRHHQRVWPARRVRARISAARINCIAHTAALANKMADIGAHQGAQTRCAAPSHNALPSRKRQKRRGIAHRMAPRTCATRRAWRQTSRCARQAAARLIARRILRSASICAACCGSNIVRHRRGGISRIRIAWRAIFRGSGALVRAPAARWLWRFDAGAPGGGARAIALARWHRRAKRRQARHAA